MSTLSCALRPRVLAAARRCSSAVAVSSCTHCTAAGAPAVPQSVRLEAACARSAAIAPDPRYRPAATAKVSAACRPEEIASPHRFASLPRRLPPNPKIACMEIAEHARWQRLRGPGHQAVLCRHCSPGIRRPGALRMWPAVGALMCPACSRLAAACLNRGIVLAWIGELQRLCRKATAQRKLPGEPHREPINRRNSVGRGGDGCPWPCELAMPRLRHWCESRRGWACCPCAQPACRR